MGRLIHWLLLLAFATIGVVLGVLNPQFVTLNLSETTLDLPLSVLLALAFVAGALAMLLYTAALWLAWRLARRRLHRRLDACEAEKLELKRRVIEKARNTNTLPDRPHA